MDIKFSVLIPVYNVKDYIIECLDSVLNQTYKNYEVIIVDDGSTDGSGAICDIYSKYEKCRIIHRSNHGLMLTRRYSIELASGDYCIFVDSDDIIDKNTLSILNDLIQSKSPDIIMFNSYLFDDRGLEYKWKRKRIFDDGKIFETLKEKQEVYRRILVTDDINNLVIKAIKTPLIKDDPCDYESIASSSMGEDLLQSLYPISEAKKILYVDKYLYFYRQSMSGMTRKPLQTLEDEFKFNLNHYDARMAYAHKWHMEDIIPQLYSYYLERVLRRFNRIYLRCHSKSERKLWAAMEWKKVLPKEVMDSFNNGTVPLGFKEKLQLSLLFKNNRIYIESYRLLRKLKNILK